MGFVTIPGLPGKVYVPDKRWLPAGKHPCPDCFACQNCGEDRCRLCRDCGPVLGPHTGKEHKDED